MDTIYFYMNQFAKSITAITMATFAGAAVGTATNPLVTGSDLPYGTMPLSKFKPADYEEGIKEGIKAHNREIEAIVNQRSNPTFENTIVALDRSGKVLNLSLIHISEPTRRS